MPLEVMDIQHRLAERVTEGVSDARAHQQRPGQPGTGRHGDGVDLRQRPAGLGQDRVQQRKHPADVVPGGQFGHHATVGHVHVDLGVQGVSQQAGVAVEERQPGLVAGGLDAQNQHPASVRERFPGSSGVFRR